MIESSLFDKIKVNRGLCLKFTSPSMTGIPDRIILLPKAKIEFIEKKDLEENQDQFKKKIRTFKKLNLDVYVLDFKENIDEIIKRIEDDNLEYTLRKYQNYPTEFIKENRKSSLLLDMGLDKVVIGLMAIKDLFFDAFAISKVLIIVLLRVA